MDTSNPSRREFIAALGMTAAGAALGVGNATAASESRVAGANERIRMGFIGVGNRGSQMLHLFQAQPDVEVAALCDVYEPYVSRDRSKVHPRYLETVGGQVPRMG